MNEMLYTGWGNRSDLLLVVKLVEVGPLSFTKDEAPKIDYKQ